MYDHSPFDDNYYPQFSQDYEPPHLNRIDIILERDDSGEEFGVTLTGEAEGPKLLSEVLEAISVHDIAVADPILSLRAVLATLKDRLQAFSLFHSDPDVTRDVGIDSRFDRSEPTTWFLRLDFVDGEIAIKHSDGPAVLRGPFDARSAKVLATSFFTELTEALDGFAPSAVAGNVRVVFSRNGDTITGVTVHYPTSGPDALAGVLAWLNHTDRSIVCIPEETATQLVRHTQGVDPLVVPFRHIEDTHTEASIDLSNNCPIVVIDCPEKKLRLHNPDGTIEAEANLHKTGAGQLRRALSKMFHDGGITLAPDYLNRYGWHRSARQFAPVF